MGRYYRAAKSVPVDYMFNLNIPLMEKVINAQDTGITDVLAQADQDKAASYFDYAPQDKAGATGLMKEYGQKIDFITNALKSNYADWRSQSGAIRGLTNELAADYKTGKISSYAATAAKRKADFAAADAMGKLFDESKVGEEKGLPQSYVERFKRKWDEDFKGTFDEKTGEVRTYQGGSVPRYHNIPKEMEAGLDKILMDEGYVHTKMPDGTSMYMREEKREWKRPNAERLLAAMAGNLTEEMKDYLYQISTIGVVPGESLVGKPFEMGTDGITPEETAALQIKQTALEAAKKDPKYTKDQIAALEKDVEDTRKSYTDNEVIKWSKTHYLAPIMSGLLSKYMGGGKETTDILYSGDEVALKKYDVAHADARAAATRQQAWAIHQDNMYWKGVENDLARQKQENDLVIASGFGGGGSSSSKTKGGMPENFAPTNEVVTTATHDYLGKTTTTASGKTVPYYSRAGLVAEKNNYDKLINESMGRLGPAKRAYENEHDPLKKAALLESMTTERKNIATYVQERKGIQNNIETAQKMVLDNQSKVPGVQRIEESDANFYRDLSKNGQAKYKKMVEDYGSASVASNTFTQGVSAEQKQAAGKTRNQLKADIDRYEAINNRVNNSVDALLKDTRETYENQGTGVSLTRTDQYYLNNMIRNDPQNNKIIDMGTMNPIGATQKIPGSDKYNMSFEGENNILDYLKQDNVNGDFFIHVVNQHGTGNNGGPVGRLTFRDGTGALEGKTWLINLNKNAADLVGARVFNSKNPEVSKVGKNMLNTNVSNLINQLDNGLINLTTGGVQGSPGSTVADFNILAPVASGAKQPVHIVATPNYSNTGGLMYKVSVVAEDGREILLPKYKEVNGKIVMYDDSGPNKGIFYSKDQIAETLDLDLKATQKK